MATKSARPPDGLTNATGDRTSMPWGYRAATAACLVGFAVNGVAILTTSPRPDRVLSAVVSLVVGAILVVTVYRPGLRKATFGFVAFVVLGLYYAAAAPAGIASGVSFPLVGSLLLVPVLSPRALLPWLLVAWLTGVVASIAAWTIGSLQVFANQTYVPTSISSIGVLSALAYVALWWVSYAWRASIAAAHRAGVEAAASDARYRDLFEQSAEAIAVTDADGLVLDVNPVLCELVDEPREALLGRDSFSMVASDQGELTKSFLAELAPRTSTSAEAALVRHDGSRIEVEASFRRLDDGSTVFTLRDIRARLEAEAARRELAAAVEHAAKMEAVGLLAGGVAHDVNNVITAIRGYTELVLEHLPESLEEDRADLREVVASAERASTITRQLLTFARKGVVQPRIVDPGAVVDGVTPMLGRMLGEDVRLEVRRAPDVGRVLVDAGQLEQVVVNLAVNARDAMPRGGRLTIEIANIELDAETATTIPETTAGSFVRLAVTDSGTGMDEEVARRVFEPFFTTKEPGKGTGMGLAMVYGVVRGAGGSIQVDTAPGSGTTVRIYMPRVSGDLEQPRIGDGGAAVQLRGGSETVLLVEDDTAVRTAARRSLEGFGYTVIEAATGEDALARVAAEGRIDALVSDTVMPGMSGGELARQLIELRPRIRVLLTSGYTEHAVLEMEAGGELFAFLPKPYTQRDLALTLRSLLDVAD